MTTLTSKICLITGANSGIGYETTLALANMGGTIVMVCRNAERGEKAAQAIRLESGNTANSLHPGVVASNFGKNNECWFFKLALMAIKPFSKNSAQGAQTSIYLATSPDVAEISGEYFSDSKIATPTAQAQDMSDAYKLWQLSLDMLELN